MNPWVPPIFRWAGSKRALLPELSARFDASGAKGRYIEPFAGSACLYFALGPRAAVLGDLNAELIDTYRVLRDHPRLLGRALRRWKTDRDSYYDVRGIDSNSLSPLERAARFLYLNRFCFNGVFRTNQSGHFNVPYGSHTGGIPTDAHLYRCSIALRKVDLRSGDFENTTADVMAGDFVYLDPPYTPDPKSAYGVYGYGSFNGSDLDRVLTRLREIDSRGATFLFSYAAVQGIAEKVPKTWSVASVSVPGRVAARVSSRTARTEILVSNAELRPPCIAA